MYYLTESNEIISDEEIKKIKGACLVITTLYDEEFQVIDRIKKQSDNVFDLIEAGDLVEEGDFNEIYKVKIFDNGNDEFRNRVFDKYNGDLYVKYVACDDEYYSYIETLGTINIVKIFKLNKKGDYIKVWEVKDNE